MSEGAARGKSGNMIWSLQKTKNDIGNAIVTVVEAGKLSGVLLPQLSYWLPENGQSFFADAGIPILSRNLIIGKDCIIR